MKIPSPWQFLWRNVWLFCETFDFSLGNAAPWVFSQMLGAKRKRMNANA